MGLLLSSKLEVVYGKRRAGDKLSPRQKGIKISGGTKAPPYTATDNDNKAKFVGVGISTTREVCTQ